MRPPKIKLEERVKSTPFSTTARTVITEMKQEWQVEEDEKSALVRSVAPPIATLGAASVASIAEKKFGRLNAYLPSSSNWPISTHGDGTPARQ